MKSMSPLLRTLLIVNLLVLLLPLIAALWPLPGQASRPLTKDFGTFDAHRDDVSDADVTEVLDRPLFHENRRKPAAIVAAPQQTTPVKRELEQPYSLAGIVGGSDGERTVYLLNKQTQETVSAKEGERVGIWLVKTISATGVTLESGNTVRTLDITGGN